MPQPLKRFLLVEDNPHVREIVAFGVRRGGVDHWPDFHFEVVSVEDGQQAMTLLRQQHFDVLITDLYLPIVDGKAIIRWARSQEELRDLKILAISASSVTAHEDSLEAGADVFLPKPLRMTELLETLQRLLHV